MRARDHDAAEEAGVLVALGIAVAVLVEEDFAGVEVLVEAVGGLVGRSD